MAISFPLRTAFAESHRFWNDVFLFSLVSRYSLTSFLISSQIHWFFTLILFSLNVFVVFAFSLCNYFLISYSVVRENAWYNYSSLKFVETWFFLWHSMWSILDNVPCTLEKNVYSAAFGWNIL